jgi:NAD+-dependent protein deacetylase SIR2
VKHLVSTNCDGLHRRSGISEQDLSELHGNCYLEICQKCNTEYLRDFLVRKDPVSHKTGRLCNEKNCKGELLGTTVAFGESLPEKELSKGVKHSEICDLSLVLGTSMRVTPACELPVLNENGKLILVNLQITPCKDFKEKLTKKLTILHTFVVLANLMK